MKLTRTFFILLCILLILSVILFSIQKELIQEGLTGDYPDGLNEVKKFENDTKYGNQSSYIKQILPLQNFIVSPKGNQGIKASHPDISMLPICQYTIKSSYNSACSGTKGYITNEMLMYVLSRGCRFVDFEIAYVSGKPHVIYPDYGSIVKIDKHKIVPLDNILKTAVTYGISNTLDLPKNFKDPLFIHLRVHPDPSYNHLYQDIASSIYRNIGPNFLYNSSTVTNGFTSDTVVEGLTVAPPPQSTLNTQLVTTKQSNTTKNITTTPLNKTKTVFDVNKTTMNDIMGKVIILFDNNYDPNWRNASKCNPKEKNCYDLNNLVHIETGIGNVTINSQTGISTQQQTPIQIGKDGISSLNQTLRLIFPETDMAIMNMAIMNQTKNSKPSNTANPDFKNLAMNWSCNFITNRFYIQDTNLRAYEDFFNQQQTAIVPLSYLKKK
jgi:hypothetical protein